MLPKKF